MSECVAGNAPHWKLSRRKLLQTGAWAGSAWESGGIGGWSRLPARQDSRVSSLLIRQDPIATTDRRWIAGIRAGKIAAIAAQLEAGEEDRIIDASELQVLPGGIDPHPYLAPPWKVVFEGGRLSWKTGGVSVPPRGKTMQLAS